MGFSWDRWKPDMILAGWQPEIPAKKHQLSSGWSIFLFPSYFSPRFFIPKIMVPPNHPFLIRFSIINHPFWGTPIFGNTLIHHLKVVGLGGFSDPFGPTNIFEGACSLLRFSSPQKGSKDKNTWFGIWTQGLHGKSISNFVFSHPETCFFSLLMLQSGQKTRKNGGINLKKTPQWLYTPQKLTWQAGKSIINRRYIFIHGWSFPASHSFVFRGCTWRIIPVSK